MNIKDIIKKTDIIIRENKNTLIRLKELYENYKNNDWISYVKFNEHRYTRNLVYRNELFQIVLMCWPKKFTSSIHNHDKSECLYKILDGNLIETIYQKTENKLIEMDKLVLNKNDVGTINDNKGIHKVFNPNNNYCISLHLYIPAYDKTAIYTISNDNTFQIATVYLNFD